MTFLDTLQNVMSVLISATFIGIPFGILLTVLGGRPKD